MHSLIQFFYDCIEKLQFLFINKSVRVYKVSSSSDPGRIHVNGMFNIESMLYFQSGLPAA